MTNLSSIDSKHQKRVFQMSFVVPRDAIPGRLAMLLTLFLCMVNTLNNACNNSPRAAGPTALIRSGFIFEQLARDPHFDNVTRRHIYSWEPSRFCEWWRGAAIFYSRFVLEEKEHFGYLGGRPQPSSESPPFKNQKDLFSRKEPLKWYQLWHSENLQGAMNISAIVCDIVEVWSQQTIKNVPKNKPYRWLIVCLIFMLFSLMEYALILAFHNAKEDGQNENYNNETKKLSTSLMSENVEVKTSSQTFKPKRLTISAKSIDQIALIVFPILFTIVTVLFWTVLYKIWNIKFNVARVCASFDLMDHINVLSPFFYFSWSKIWNWISPYWCAKYKVLI